MWSEPEPGCVRQGQLPPSPFPSKACIFLHLVFLLSRGFYGWMSKLQEE